MRILVLLQGSGPWTGLLDRLREMWAGAESGLAGLLVVIGVILVGWAIAALLSRLLLIVLRTARFNQAVRAAFPGWSAASDHEPAGFASWALFWLVMIVAIVLALDTLGWGLSASVSERLRDVLPRVVASALLLLVGVLFAMLLAGVARRFFAGAGIRGARLRGQIVGAVFTFFAVVLALEQLGLAAQFVMALGITAFGAVALALGLAFGLGCRELARDFVVEYLRSLDEDRPRRPS
ncbi:MAG TPA: hypothetical protein VMS88_05470 [Terriglobales bacterium]|nr:hypothetical protein [Terriglobales bacterium]